MRRVPQYLIIGNGRMATHMCAYFDYLNIPYKQWWRRDHCISILQQLAKQSSHVLILISDSAIESFVEQHLQMHKHLNCIHFSGSLHTKLAFSVHPLCTFQKGRRYTLKEYQAIPFIIDDTAPEFTELLSGLNNAHYRIKQADKAYYHAMCVMANNFSTLLWDKFFTEMQQRFAIDTKHLIPMLEKTFSNLKQYPDINMTGPLTRGDKESLQRGVNALENDRYQSIFKSFIETFLEDENEHC